MSIIDGIVTVIAIICATLVVISYIFRDKINGDDK
jgi:hypothetical protein